MEVSNSLDTITFIACPPPGMAATGNAFIDAAYRTLIGKQAVSHCVLRASSVRDIDLQLAPLLPRPSAPKVAARRVRLQIIGHSISGVLSLGASWLGDDELADRAFAFPYLVLDTNPAALALLAKYVGRLAEVMLVGCNVGGASSFGYAINGRTLTYTLTELFRCPVRGADDVVSPDEFDGQGWYAPREIHRRPQGWRWIEGQQPLLWDESWDDACDDAWDAPEALASGRWTADEPDEAQVFVQTGRPRA